MTISLKKFGSILTSRQPGQEALAAFTPNLAELATEEKLSLDFAGVDVLAPSWADEFLTPLQQHFGDKLTLRNVTNASAQASIVLLEEIHKIKFNIV